MNVLTERKQKLHITKFEMAICFNTLIYIKKNLIFKISQNITKIRSYYFKLREIMV